MSEDKWSDEDTPWADPAIRGAYEAALGRFILRFNEIDHRLRGLLRTVLARSGVPSLAEVVPFEGYGKKLDFLTALKQDPEGSWLQSLPVVDLRDLGRQRNFAAHGHFDQNPFAGDYKTEDYKRRDYLSVDELDALTARADKLLDQLRLTEARYVFADVFVRPRPSDSSADRTTE